MAKSNDNLTLRRHVWFARIGVPVAVQGIIGKTVLEESTGERELIKARLASLPIIARMRQRIADAQLNAVDTLKTEAATLARQYMDARKFSADEAMQVRITDVMTFALETLPRAKPADATALMLRTRGNLNVAMASVKGAVAADGFITGTHTPFTTHEAAWHAAKSFNSKTAHEYRQTMACFVKTVGKPCEALTWEDVRGWLRGLQAGGNSAKTLSKKLATVGGFWRWMCEERLIIDTAKPFDGHKIARDKMADAKNARRRFEPHDVVAILAAADARCAALGDLTALGMFTGARRESLAGLNVRDIATSTDGIRHFQFADKTPAGFRQVPVHAAIASRVDRLVANATKDGQLFHAKADKHGDFGTALGQKFGELKTDMGFDGRFAFHCIRKTFAHLMAEASVSEKLVNDIAGWESGDMQSHYAQEASLNTKQAALAKLVYPTA